jgi:Xaa-Pro aminopeptidase
MKQPEKWMSMLNQENVAAAVIFDLDNLVYASGICLPFPKDYPDLHVALCISAENKMMLVVPAEWKQAVLDQGWQGLLYAYPAGVPPYQFMTVLTSMLQEHALDSAAIGIDMNGLSDQILRAIHQNLPQIKTKAIDHVFSAMRMIKDVGEIKLLEKASRFVELGIVAAINHFEGMVEAVSFSMQETTERMRVHAGEFGGSATGHMAALQGAELQHYYVPPHGKIQEGHMLRYDLTSAYQGYWACSGRTIFVGEKPQQEYNDAYEQNLLLKQAVVSMIAPGAVCKKIFQAVNALATQHQISLITETDLGYGVGVSEREGPYINPLDETILMPGMVLVADIVTRGPNGALIRNADTYVIEENGSRLLSWYRNYDRLYRAFGSTAVHG